MDISELKITIGIESHVQLNTATKMFSRCENKNSEEPNKNVDFITSGQLGWYPKLNKSCVKKAVQFGLAINGSISPVSSFYRKCYFYPDNPKNYQITQEKNPIVEGGSIKILKGKKSYGIDIERIQMEEDTANTKNFGAISGINLNRAGAPLIEIITKPCIHSIKDAVKTCKEIRNLVIANNISNGSLENGDIRFDCNVSINNADGSLGVRYEIKNLNSFANIEKAVSKALIQQKILIDNSEEIIQSTFRWDAEKKCLITLREKTAAFYGFLPEIDIPPVIIDSSYIDALHSTIAENPVSKTLRIMNELYLDEDEARVISENYLLESFIKNVVKLGASKKDAFSWVCVESRGILSKITDENTPIYEKISSQDINKVISLVKENKISRVTGKEIISSLIKGTHDSVDIFIKENSDLLIDKNKNSISDIISSVLEENEEAVEKIKQKNLKPYDFLVGCIMKKAKGVANISDIKSILNKHLDL